MCFRVSPLASVVLLGWVIATSQTMLLREALAAAQGNELAIALALGQWLVLTAAGSAAAGLLSSRLSRRFFVVGALLLGPALFAALLTARGLPRVFSVAPGALLTLDQHVLGLLFTLAPVCLVAGASFTLACRLPGVEPTRAYLAEAAGWLLGGVTATWLVETWQPFAVAAALTVGAVLAAVLLVGRAWVLAAVGLAVIAALGQRGLGAIEARSLAWRWPGETIEASAYTRHGHVAVLLRAEQRALYEDGHLDLVLPERQSSEELAHLALLQVPAPRRIFVARGLGGLLPEILKHPVAEVALAEPEPSLAEMEIQAADPATRQALRDPRVHILIGDVRNLLRRSAAAWGAGELRSPRTIAGGIGGPPRVPITDTEFDAVLLSTAEPSTLLASRLLTRESFAEARRALRPGGVLALALPGAENYYSPELVARNGAVYKALAAVFAYVLVTPLSTNYFLASDAPLNRDPVELARRLERRKITATFVDEYSLAVLMPEERVQSLAKRYSEATVAASSDRLPTAYLHNLLVSGRVDSGRVADLLRWALGLGFWSLALGLAVLLVVPALIAARGRRVQRPALLVVSLVGFASMASAVLILAVTQSAMGVLHHLLGALLAANMAGLAFAAWGAGELRSPRTIAGGLARPSEASGEVVAAGGPKGEADPPRVPIAMSALGVGLLVPAMLPLLSRVSTQVPPPLMMAALLLASLAAGAAVGIAFGSALVVGTTPAATYVIDLLGAALAAPVVAAVALPGFGLDAACALVALLAVPAALALAVSRQRQP
jgi:spermidine synthase